MTHWLNVFTIGLVSAGLVFFVAGSLGILRFQDSLSRLHALTKADNVGLGFVVFGLMLQCSHVLEVGRLVFIWLLALLASSSSCYLIGQNELRAKREKSR